MPKAIPLYLLFLLLYACNPNTYTTKLDGERKRVLPARMILTTVESVGKNQDNTWHITFVDERGGVVMYVDGLKTEPAFKKGWHMQALIKY